MSKPTTFGFGTCQAGGGLQKCAPGTICGKSIGMVSQHFGGNRAELIVCRQRMLDDNEGVFQFERDLYYGRQHHDKRAPLFSGDELLEKCLNNLDTAQKPMKVRQDQQCRLVV